MIDFEVQRCTRRCALTGRTLEPGEKFFSVLESHGAEIVRCDFAASAWEGPPNDAIGWWQSQMPTPEANRPQWAPNDVMLDLLARWADVPDRVQIRYVLGLLLIRRRVLREVRKERSTKTPPALRLYCPRNEETYELLIATPDNATIKEIQQELAQLLFANAN